MTKIIVSIKTRCKNAGVEKIDDENYVVRVNEPPVDNRANKAMINLLAEYFGIPKFRVEIVAGHHSRRKIMEIV